MCNETESIGCPLLRIACQLKMKNAHVVIDQIRTIDKT